MKKVKAVFWVYILTLMLGLTSCGMSDYHESPEGLRYKILERGQGLVLPQLGEIVFCSYIIKNENDTIIYSSYDNLKGQDRLPVLNSTHLGGDIFSALRMMSEGDSMAFLIPADSFFLKTRNETRLPDNVKKGSDLQFVIKLDKIVTVEQYEEIKNKEKYDRWVKEVEDIDAYFTEKGWKDTRFENGVRYFITQESNGTKAQMGKEVSYHCVGKVLKTGTEFTNTYLAGSPISFVLGDPSIRPEVLTQMLGAMKEGEKASFLVPFDHAFGERGLENLVPPYSTVIYEIHLIAVK